MNSHLGGEPRSAIIHKSARLDKGQSLSGKTIHKWVNSGFGF